MYPCTKFQSIWKTSNFGTKFIQKNMSDKYFEKISIKFEIKIWQCTPVPNFSQFGELGTIFETVCGTDFSPKTL